MVVLYRIGRTAITTKQILIICFILDFVHSFSFTIFNKLLSFYIKEFHREFHQFIVRVTHVRFIRIIIIFTQIVFSSHRHFLLRRPRLQSRVRPLSLGGGGGGPGFQSPICPLPPGSRDPRVQASHTRPQGHPRHPGHRKLIRVHPGSRAIRKNMTAQKFG